MQFWLEIKNSDGVGVVQDGGIEMDGGTTAELRQQEGRRWSKTETRVLVGSRCC
jgi:hypothetical protein